MMPLPYSAQESLPVLLAGGGSAEAQSALRPLGPPGSGAVRCVSLPRTLPRARSDALAALLSERSRTDAV